MSLEIFNDHYLSKENIINQKEFTKYNYYGVLNRENSKKS